MTEDFDKLTVEDIDNILFEMNKNRKIDAPGNVHRFTGDEFNNSSRIVKDLNLRHNTKHNSNLKVKVSLKNVYRYMNTSIQFINRIDNELNYDKLLSIGLPLINKDSIVLLYINALKDLRDDESIYKTSRFSSWDSRDEDFHFIYECNEIYNITYSSDNDIKIGNMSNELKLHKHKVIAVALNYAFMDILSNLEQKRNTLIYDYICEEIEWFRDQYQIKREVLEKLFKKKSPCNYDNSTIK